jgi:hypothetical protein
VGLYNFQKRFVEYIELGLAQPDHPNAKLHTIRARRNREDKPGDTMHLYVGLRRPGARLIARVPCVRVEHFEIVMKEQVLDVRRGKGGFAYTAEVFIADDRLADSEADALAKHDGFPGGLQEMVQFWHKNHGLGRFCGRIYHWGRP